jgi:hypothetical protein
MQTMMNTRTIKGIALAAILSFFGTAHAHYEMMEGQGWRFCEALYAEIQRQEDKDESAWSPFECMAQAARSLPGVTEPEWQELDVKEHEGLLRNIALYQQLGPVAYFDPEYRKREIERLSKSRPTIQDRVEAAVNSARTGQTRLFVTHVNVMHRNPATGAPDPQPETIVRKVYSKPDPDSWAGRIIEDCNRRYPGISDEGRDILVKNDLSDVDPERSPNWYASSQASSINVVLFYEGKEYVVHYGGGDVDLMRDAHDTGIVSSVCWIRYRRDPSYRTKGQRK